MIFSLGEVMEWILQKVFWFAYPPFELVAVILLPLDPHRVTMLAATRAKIVNLHFRTTAIASKNRQAHFVFLFS